LGDPTTGEVQNKKRESITNRGKGKYKISSNKGYWGIGKIKKESSGVVREPTRLGTKEKKGNPKNVGSENYRWSPKNSKKKGKRKYHGGGGP